MHNARREAKRARRGKKGKKTLFALLALLALFASSSFPKNRLSDCQGEAGNNDFAKALISFSGCVDNPGEWRYRWRVQLLNIGLKRIVNIHSYIPTAAEMIYAKRDSICACCCCPSYIHRNRPPMRVIIQT
jgi:hypothetical protein